MADAEVQTQLRRDDAAARRAAKRVFDRPLILEAGAGTGKTATLVARIVAWALGSGWERARIRAEAPAEDSRLAREAVSAHQLAQDVLSRMVAITFTDAAAAEMAERVGSALAILSEGQLPVGVDPDDFTCDGQERASRARTLLGVLDQLSVRTIHAWCRGLLARFPVEAGLHPHFQVDASSRIQEATVREVVEEALRAAYGSAGSSPLLDLAAEGYGPVRVEEAILALVQHGARAEDLTRDPFDADSIARFTDVLRDAVAGFREADGGRLAAAKRSGVAQQVLDALDATETVLARGATVRADELQELARATELQWPKNRIDRLRDWSRPKFNGAESEALGEDRAALIQAAGELHAVLKPFVELEPLRLERARQALAPILDEVGNRLRIRGVATYASLLSGAQALLLAHPGVAETVRRDLDQILVDEFQDTDALQCDIVRQIAFGGADCERPALFLVGDPKQSIYGWRDADLRAYENFVEEVKAAGGELHRLSVNFRSAPAILAEVERVMSVAMRPTAGVQPGFEPLAPVDDPDFIAGFERPEHTGTSGQLERASVEHWVSWNWDPDRRESDFDATKVGDALRIESRSIAADIRHVHDQDGVGWGEIGLLLRAATDLDTYLESFRDWGIPYAVERDRSYYRRREVIDAAAIVRTILDPTDVLALLTFLRSSAVGVPDAALVPLWSRELPRLVGELHGPSAAQLRTLEQVLGEVASALPSDVPGIEGVRGWELNALAAFEAVAALRRTFDQEPPDVFVEQLRAFLLYEAGEAARYLGRYRVANLERFHRELLDAMVSEGDCQQVLRRLRVDILQQRDAEEERPKADSEDAVRVMTIHRAKGLDFGHVYIPQLHKGSGRGSTRAVELNRDASGIEYSLFGATTLGWGASQRLAEQTQDAERVRTLYVAMTRAKHRLVTLGTWPAAAGASPQAAGSHAELLALRFGASNETGLIELHERLGKQEVAGERDEQGVLWRFPALAGAPEPTSDTLTGLREASPAHEAASVAGVAQLSERLFVLRAQARSRMGRRWRDAATRLASHENASRGSRGDELEPMLARHEAWEERASDALETAGAWDFSDGASVAPRVKKTTEAQNPRSVATAAGTVVHRLLEEFDLDAPWSEELARQRARLPQLLATQEGGKHADAVRTRADELLDRLQTGGLLARLCGLGDACVARELPILLPADFAATLVEAEVDASPVGFASAVIDLLYRDPDSGEWVVADFKTDRLEGEDALAERASRYSGQGALYAHAAQHALGLSQTPRFELWFLWADTVVEVESHET